MNAHSVLRRGWPLLVASAIGCNSTTPSAADVHAVVMGRITDATGSGIGNRWVVVTVYAPNKTPDEFMARDSQVTAADGTYGMTVALAHGSPMSANVQVSARSAQGGEGVEKLVGTLRFTGGFPPSDTLRADLTVP